MGTTIMRCAIVGVGVLLMIASFYFHAGKRMNSDLATVWCVLGLSLVIVGAVPMLSKWLDLISLWTGVALLCVGAACLLGAFQICLMISKLMAENQELAMMVSILLSERRQEEKDDTAEDDDRVTYEENTVCH